jgi:hypothetical protein
MKFEGNCARYEYACELAENAILYHVVCCLSFAAQPNVVCPDDSSMTRVQLL